MDSKLTFDQLSEGQTWVSSSRTITEADVINFATQTGDMNPLHVDRTFAENSPFRQPVAHGLLGLAWVAGLGSHSPAVDTMAFVAVREWVFDRPLFFGDTVCVRSTVVSMQSDARRAGRVVWKHELLNQHDQVAQHGIFETLVRVAPEVSRPHIHVTQKGDASPAGKSGELLPDEIDG